MLKFKFLPIFVLICLYCFPPLALDAQNSILTDLDIEKTTEGLIITWEDLEDPYLIGYNIYRFEDDNEVMERINQAPLAESNFLDSDVNPNDSYSYLVKVVFANRSGVTSVPVTDLIDKANNYGNLYNLVQTNNPALFPQHNQDKNVEIILIEPTDDSLDYSVLANNCKILILDGIYENWDETYKDIKLIWQKAGKGILSMKKNVDGEEVYGTAIIPHKNRYLALHDIADLRKALSSFPLFFSYFDGVKIDATYLSRIDTAQCRRDKEWIDLKKLIVIVDFSREINYWPGLRFCDLRKDLYEPERSDYVRSVKFFDDVLEKMKIIGSTNAIIATHNGPLDQYPIEPGIINFCNLASKGGITVHLQNNHLRKKGSPSEISNLIGELKGSVDNIKYAANMINNNNKLNQVLAKAGSDLGIVILGANGMDQRNAVSGSTTKDVIIYQPLNTVSPDVSAIHGLNVPIVLDGEYKNWEEIQADCLYLNW